MNVVTLILRQFCKVYVWYPFLHSSTHPSNARQQQQPSSEDPIRDHVNERQMISKKLEEMHSRGLYMNQPKLISSQALEEELSSSSNDSLRNNVQRYTPPIGDTIPTAPPGLQSDSILPQSSSLTQKPDIPKTPPGFRPLDQQKNTPRYLGSPGRGIMVSRI